MNRLYRLNGISQPMLRKYIIAHHRAIICQSYAQVTSVRNSLQKGRCVTTFSPNRSQDRQHVNVDNNRNLLFKNNLHGEVKALSRLLARSGFNGPGDVLQLCVNASRPFSTTTRNAQRREDPDENKDEEKQPEEDEKMPIVARLMLMFWLMFFLYVVLRVQNSDESGMYRFVSWNEFYHDMLLKGEVEEIIIRPEQEIAFIRLHSDAVVKNKKLDSDIFTLKIPDPYKFEDKLRKVENEIGIRAGNGIPISYQRESSWAPLIFTGIVILAIFLLLRNVKIQMPNASDMFAGERKAKFVRADLQPQQGKGITFSDVAGLHEAKVEIIEFVDYIKRPEKYNDLGGKAPKGALLLGPPGCGKTLLAKALANEAKVPFLAMAGSEFVEMLGGLGAARVRDLFKEARQKAPCIIYIDEIDAIGRKRSGDNWATNTEEEHTLNQLLVEMDGMSTKAGVIMLASTNRSDILDMALLRPGRFDRHIMIDFPTLAERQEIFNMYLRRLKLSKLPETYPERLAQLSPGMSGADIANICNEAALHAARIKKTNIDTDDFEYAVERVVAGVAKRSRVLSPQEKKIVAYHEAGHALIGWLLEHTDPLLRVSIIPRTSSALGFAQYLPNDNRLHSMEELFERMCMALGGRVAESQTFNSVTSGAQDDLRKVTQMAYDQIRHLGMNDTVGQVAFPVNRDDQSPGTRPYSKHLTHIIDQEAKLLVGRAYTTTEKMMKDNKEKLRMIAEALLEKEALTYKDVEQLIGPPVFRKNTFMAGFDVPADAH